MLYKLCLHCSEEPIFVTSQRTKLNAIRFFSGIKNMKVRDLLMIYRVVPYTRPAAGGIIHATY